MFQIMCVYDLGHNLQEQQVKKRITVIHFYPHQIKLFNKFTFKMHISSFSMHLFIIIIEKPNLILIKYFQFIFVYFWSPPEHNQKLLHLDSNVFFRARTMPEFLRFNEWGSFQSEERLTWGSITCYWGGCLGGYFYCKQYPQSIS